MIQRVLDKQPEEWSLVDSRNPSVCTRITMDPQSEIGYITHNGGHWRALRGISSPTGGRDWYDLDSLLPNGPRYTADAHIRTILNKTVGGGGTVFVVIRRQHMVPEPIRTMD